MFLILAEARIGNDFAAPQRLLVKRFLVSDIVIRCPLTKRPVSTGLTTDMIVLETLPNVDVPLRCRACGQIHRWTPNDAWTAATPKLVHSLKAVRYTFGE